MSDAQLNSLWREVQPDVGILSQGSSGLNSIAQQVAAGRQAPVQSGVSLLDLDDEVGSKSGLDEREKQELEKAISDAQERLDRLGKVRRERDEVLKDLKDKVSFHGDSADDRYKMMMCPTFFYSIADLKMSSPNFSQASSRSSSRSKVVWLRRSKPQNRSCKSWRC